MFLLVKNQAPSRLGHLISGTVQDLDALVASHDVRGQLSAPSGAARCGEPKRRRRWGGNEAGEISMVLSQLLNVDEC